MSADELSYFSLSDELSADELSADELSTDELSADELSADELSGYRFIKHVARCFLAKMSVLSSVHVYFVIYIDVYLILLN